MSSLCPFILILSGSWLVVAMLLERRAAADACLLPIQKAFNGGRPVAAPGAQTASFKGSIERPNQYTPHQRDTETDRCSLRWCNQLFLAIVEHQYFTSRLLNGYLDNSQNNHLLAYVSIQNTWVSFENIRCNYLQRAMLSVAAS